MPDISELNLSEEATPSVDWDAPESGSFPPRLRPSTYEFIFALPENAGEQFDKITVQGKDYLQVNWIAKVIGANTQQATSGEAGDYDVPFQRTSFFKTEKMPISFGADLMRSIGLRLEQMSPAKIAEALRGVSGRARGRGDLGWDYYCKPCGVRVSTNPNKKKGDIAWPKDAGGYTLQVRCPKCGQGGYGREQFVRFHLPKVGAVAPTAPVEEGVPF